MLLAFSREGNGLGVGVLLMLGKWLPVPLEGFYVNRSIL
jgi:hypothetical protein